MLAHYVLGFAYRDMGDSPSALRCFNEAVAVADTSDADCDIHQLYLAHCQIAQIFMNRCLADEALQAFGQAMHCAKSLTDSAAIYTVSCLESDAFIIKGDIGKAISRKEYSAEGFQKLGRHQLAAQTKGTCVEWLARRGEYSILDHFSMDYVKHTLFNVPSAKGKGVLFSPTTHFNYLIGPSADFVDERDDVSTSIKGLSEIKNQVLRLVDDPQYPQQIRTFSGLRAYSDNNDFIIEETSPSFINVAGIQSPGLASSPAIAKMVEDMIKDKKLKESWNPRRRKAVKLSRMSLEEKNELVKKDKSFGHIVCRCEKVSEGEIVDVIRRNCGATTVKGVKKRIRPGMGKCQGGFCQEEVVRILARELNKDPMDILYSTSESHLFVNDLNKEER